MHISELLVPAMKKLGFDDTDALVGKAFIFESQKPSFECSNPRWIPVGVPNGKKTRRRGKKQAN